MVGIIARPRKAYLGCVALYPDAVRRLLPENSTQPRIVPVSAIWHSAVDAPGPTSLHGYFARADVGLESHFFIRLNGVVEQYMDTEVRADANFRANAFFRDVGNRYVRCGAISVETEDEGNPNERPWTPAQMNSSIKLGKWIVATHRIPPVLCRQWDGDGFGYHTLFPNDWTNVRGKTCPGTVRIPQFKQEILPAIAGKEDDEVVEVEIIKAFDRYLHRLPSDTELSLHSAYAAFHGLGKAVLNIARSQEAQSKR